MQLITYTVFISVRVANRDSHLIVMWRELMEQLFDAVFLSWAVHIGHLVLRQRAVVMINLHTRAHTHDDPENYCMYTSNPLEPVAIIS